MNSRYPAFSRHLLVLLIFAFQGIAAFADAPVPADPDTTNESLTMMERARQLYEEWLRRGSEISDNTRAWLEDDLRRIGAWQYKVVVVHHENLEELEKRQNMLGRERWECYWIQPGPTQTVLYLKRRQISYLQRVYQADLFRFLPGVGGGNGDGEDGNPAPQGN